MRTAANIKTLLPELDHCIADDLEDQDLDFKQWELKSRDDAVKSRVDGGVHGQWWRRHRRIRRGRSSSGP